ncbi:MAG: hypothetical protein OEY72_02740, partial [Gammaproteobacteria bacterium]|nr:hypothetical protein [Gammaproteobacteria bacterium]
LELTGVKLLGQVACTGALAVSGPLQPFICGEFATRILDNVEPVVHEVLVIVRDFPNVNVWKLVTTVGFNLACEIVKNEGVPLADEACGLLGEAIKAIKDLADAVGSVMAAAAGLANDATIAIMGGGGAESISAEELYNAAYRSLMYKRALQRLTQNRQDLGFDDKEMKECLETITVHCQTFELRLRAESEALVKLVQTMPGTYATGFLADAVRQRAVDRYGQGATLLQYVNKLPITDWAALVSDASGVSLMAAHTGINAGDQEFFKGLWRECGFWVNERLTGSRNYGVPEVADIAPKSLTNWICFKGAAQQFFQAQVEEEKRLTKIKEGLNSLGCPSVPGTSFSFNCQSHISFSICVNQSYKDYGKNRYCKADRDKTAQSLGASLVDVLGDTRCRYVPLSKGTFGDFDPRVQCSRPWKEQTCNALLDTFRAKFEVPSSRIQMRCAYNPDKEFLEQEARAKQILAVLNGGPTAELSPDTGHRSLPPAFDSKFCKTLWDPLAINCPHQTKMPTLTGDLAMPAIESCPPDPNKNGANNVCYQTVFTAADSNKEIYENQTLSPVNPPPQNLPPPAAGPARTASPGGQPVPSPVANAGQASALPGSVAQSVPSMTTMSGPVPGQPDPNTAPARTAAPAIRALNSQQGAAEAPPNPCRMAVSYYVPQQPVVSVSSTRLLVNDQFQIQCSFKKVTRDVDWPQCDAAARTAMQILQRSEESGSRYSGIVAIDGNTVGVTSSPEDGNDFAGTKTWKFEDPGAHEVSCQIDNAFRYAAEGSPTYLNSAVTFDVSARSDGLTYRAYKPEAASTLPVRALPSEAVPTARDGRFRVNGADAPARGNNSLVNPSLNPQPEVPSSKRAGTDDMVNPSLNPQPEVPSRKLEREGATASPRPVPSPDPPSPDLGSNAPENFTGAAGQVSNSAFDPQKEFASVRTVQGAVAMSNDLNDLGIAPLVVEAESLIATAAVSAGQMIRQDMSGFGAAWGGNAQLFWRPPAPVGSKPHMLTEFIVSNAGTYDLVLFYTTAPDFGRFTVYIDGSHPSQQDGYNPQVALRQVLLGRYPLAAGRHELAFEVTGKNEQSTDYIVGVDRLQLTAVP